VLIKVEPDVDYDWHENPVPQWIVPLSGRWFVETMDGHRSGALDAQPAMLMLIQLERISPEVAAAS